MNGKKFVRGTILTVLCMAGMLYFNSSVSRAYWVVVKSNNTRVRNAASTESDVMTAVNAGDRLDVYSEEQGADGNTWYKVTINNVSGYVRADTVEKAAEGDTELTASVTSAQAEPSSSGTVEPMASQAATVKEDGVNVRSEASTNGSVVAELPQGAAVTLTGSSSDSSGEIWYQVNFINNGSNVTGYIRADYVEPGEIVEQEGVPEGGGDELADIYGDMPTEDGSAAPNNEYELFFEADQEGVDCWYIHDNVAQKRYKLEQLMQADEMNTQNLEIKDKEINKLRIALIVLAVLFVFALFTAGFFGFKYHDIKDGDDDDDEEDDDEDDDFREAPPVRRRSREEADQRGRSREVSRSEGRTARGTQRRAEPGAQRRPSASQRRPEAEGRSAQRSAQARRTEAETPRKPAGAGTRGAQPSRQMRRSPAAPEKPTPRASSRGDVEWKSKNFLAGDEDGLDFSFIDMDEDV